MEVSKYVAFRKGYAFVSTESKKFWFSSKLMKSDLIAECLLKMLATDTKKEIPKDYKIGDIMLMSLL
ncbi:hypothetical protein ACRRTK_002672 [Alexandromys fortis]